MGLKDQLSLFQGLQSFITPDFVSKASGLLGSSPDQTRSGLKHAIPTLLMGVVNRGSTPEGANQLMRSIQEDGYDSGVPSNYLDRFSGGEASERYLSKGHEAVSGIFGSQSGSIMSRLAGASGSDERKTSRLMGLIAPLAMGTIGSIVKKKNMNASSLSSFLGEQRSGLQSMLPSGVGNFFERGETDKVRTLRREEPELRRETPIARGGYQQSRAEPHHKRRSMALPLALIALLGLGLFFLSKNRARHDEVATTTTKTETATNVDEQAGRAAKPQQPKAAASTEAGNRLASALDSSNTALPQRIELNSVNFATGSSKLDTRSQSEISDVAKVLGTHPSAKVVVQGFTDKVGDSAANQKLSEERARAVQQALTQSGANANQVSVAGRGEDRPAATTGGSQESQDSRRVDLLLTQR